MMAKQKPMIAIKADPNDPEDFDVSEAMLNAGLAERRKRRGAQKAPVKVPVSLRLDGDVVAALRASGNGWQARVNTLLRKHVI